MGTEIWSSDGERVYQAVVVVNPETGLPLDYTAGTNTTTVISTTGNLTLGGVDFTYYICLVAGAHIVTLPTAVTNKALYTVKNNHSADITINTTSSQTIDGTTSIVIAPQDSVDIVSDNANWSII